MTVQEKLFALKNSYAGKKEKEKKTDLVIKIKYLIYLKS